MQRSDNSAQQDDQPGSAPLNWRQRKKLVARRKQLEEESAARKPQLIAAFVQALGGRDRIGPLVMLDIERAVDLTLIAAEQRAAVRLGTAKLADLTRLEGAADRAIRRLGLPPPGSAAPVMDLHDHAAKRALERAKAQPTAEEADD
jgi:hypothetical protein